MCITMQSNNIATKEILTINFISTCPAARRDFLCEIPRPTIATNRLPHGRSQLGAFFEHFGDCVYGSDLSAWFKPRGIWCAIFGANVTSIMRVFHTHHLFVHF